MPTRPDPAKIAAEAAERAARKNTPAAPVAAAPEPTQTPLKAEDVNLDGLNPVTRSIVTDALPLLLDLIHKGGGGGMSEARLRALIDAAVLRLVPRPTVLHVTGADKVPGTDLGIVHKQVPRLVELITRQVWSGQVPYLVGPAGSTKTHAAGIAAKVLGLPFTAMAVNIQTSKADLAGYRDAHGRPVETALKRSYTEGGVFLLDEIDATHPGVLLIINSLVSQDEYTWSDGTTTTKHPNFRLVIAANTTGTGANAQYVGRLQLDAATLNRFRFIPWEYDTEYERAAALATYRSVPDAPVEREPEALRFVERVHTFRKANEACNLKYIRSIRQIKDGVVALACGDSFQTAEEEVLWANVTREDRERLLAHF